MEQLPVSLGFSTMGFIIYSDNKIHFLSVSGLESDFC